MARLYLSSKRVFGTVAVMGISALACEYLSDSRAAIYKGVLLPLARYTDPEKAHVASIWLAKQGLVPKERHSKDSSLLSVRLWGKTISNPIGLAAGYDKHGEAIDALFDFGFGMVEIGSITPLPQPGNPKPRMFRLFEDQAVINRYGFNSVGHEAVIRRLRTRLQNYTLQSIHNSNSTPAKVTGSLLPLDINNSLRRGKLLGINLGKNKFSAASDHLDYVNGVRDLGIFSDYLVVNISSPNTPGLRSLQSKAPIHALLSEVKNARDNYCKDKPLVVKIAPDLSDQEIQDIAQVVMDVGIDGVIIGNTTLKRPLSLKTNNSVSSEQGGLSGRPLKTITIQVVRKFYAETHGKVPIIGCGGISSADDVFDYVKAGASIVQLYTSLGYQGPGIVADLKDELRSILQRDGMNWSQLIGSDHKNLEE